MNTMFTGYKDYIYLYETHLHTSQGSRCGRNTGAEMARAAKEYGYTGIFVTDHNWGGNCAVDPTLPWEEWVDQYCKGYEDAKVEGDKIGLDVFWGVEASHQATDFLLYGITPQWLKDHPEMREADEKKQYELIHGADGFVVHAHPFREERYIPAIRLFPYAVDAVEGVNATHSNSHSKGHTNPRFDVRAIAYAREYGFPMTAGSDIHAIDLYGGGTIFKKKLNSINEYKGAIMEGEYILTNGEVIYDRFGNVLDEV